MQAKKFAAMAVALVTGGVIAETSDAAITGLIDPSFEQSAAAYPGAGYDQAFVGWYHGSSVDAWFSQAADPGNTIAGTDGVAYGTIEPSTSADGYDNGNLFQQVGTYDPNTSVVVKFLAGNVPNTTGGTFTVNVFSGGAVVTKPSNYSQYGSQYDIESLSGSTLLASSVVANLPDSGFVQEQLTLDLGSAGVSGDALYLAFTNASGPQVAFDDVSIAAVPEPASLTVLAAIGLMAKYFMRRRLDAAGQSATTNGDGT